MEGKVHEASGLSPTKRATGNQGMLRAREISPSQGREHQLVIRYQMVIPENMNLKESRREGLEGEKGRGHGVIIISKT